MEDRDMLGIDEVLERLDNYSHRSDEYRTKCPSHDGGSDDSLAIRENGKGKVLLHCHAGVATSRRSWRPWALRTVAPAELASP
jgi:hypothetical protein